ncbi:hypothetical protein QTP88_026472 [Uroleucon formosanum]
MSKVLFTVIEDEKLVEMVAKFNCLYDLGCKLYKNQTIKDNAWKEVAEQVKRSANPSEFEKPPVLESGKKFFVGGCSFGSSS